LVNFKWVNGSIVPLQNHTIKLPLTGCPNALGHFHLLPLSDRFTGKKIMVKVKVINPFSKFFVQILLIKFSKMVLDGPLAKP
jgi:hypothetical protein